MINKKTIIYWAICLFILVSGIHYLDGMPEIDDWPGFLNGVFWAVVLLVVVSIIVAGVIATFRIRGEKMPEKQQIRAFIPLSTISLTVIAFIAFIVTRPSYAKSKAAEPMLCQTVKEGKFQLDDYIIERTGSIQTETNTLTKENVIFNLNWISDCEYQLVNTKDNNDISKVKILEVSNDRYQCVVRIGHRTTKHELMILKKTTDSNEESE